MVHTVFGCPASGLPLAAWEHITPAGGLVHAKGFWKGGACVGTWKAGMATVLFWTICPGLTCGTTCSAWTIAWDPGASTCLMCMCIGAVCATGVMCGTMLLGACVCTAAGIIAPGAWTHAPAAGAVMPCANCPCLICGECAGWVGKIGTLFGASITALCAEDMKAGIIVCVAGGWLCPAICMNTIFAVLAWWGTDGTTECIVGPGTKLRGA